MMTTSELIAAVGADVIGIQPLDGCVTALHWSEKKGTRITFGSDVKIMSGGKTERFGLVVWLPRDRLKAVTDAANAKKKPAPKCSWCGTDGPCECP